MDGVDTPDIDVQQDEDDIIAISEIDTGSLKEQTALEQFLRNNERIEQVEDEDEERYHIDHVTDEIDRLLPDITALVLAYRGGHQDEIQDAVQELGQDVVDPAALSNYTIDEDKIGFYNKSNARDDFIQREKSQYSGENLYSWVDEFESIASFIKGKNALSRVGEATIHGSCLKGQNILENVDEATIQESYISGRNAAKRADEIDLQDSVIHGANALTYVDDAEVYDSVIAGNHPFKRHSDGPRVEIHNSVIIGDEPGRGTDRLSIYDSIIAGDEPLVDADADLHDTYVIDSETVAFYSNGNYRRSEPDQEWELDALLTGDQV